VEIGKAAQKGKMALAPGRNLIEIIAGANGCAGQQQKDFCQRISDAP